MKKVVKKRPLCARCGASDFLHDPKGCHYVNMDGKLRLCQRYVLTTKRSK